MSEITLNQFFPQSFLSDSYMDQTLGEEFPLCDNGNMVFHWADFHETCDVVKQHLENNPALREDYRKREAGLLKLELIPVWIKTKNKVFQTTMHDLYEKYLLNRSQLMGGLDPFDPMDISFISGTGPFKTMAIAECFNKSTYKDFVLVYLLKGKLPRRDYRLRLKSKILVEYGDEFDKAQLVHLEQITMNGILISLDSKIYNDDMAKEKHMRVLLDTKSLKDGVTKNLPELQAFLSQFAFNLMYSSRKQDAMECLMSDISPGASVDYFKNKKAYLFVPYKIFSQESAQNVEDIKKFVAHTKTLVLAHFNEALASKSKSA